ncbi:MAG: FAD-dependent oxidoreductase [Ruminococcus sp.]|nr:FAD-dependent oxidoreductase [Candidatus Apopatosoma intestinale]
MYDLIIIGGGPAGLTAALYARRANKSVIVLEKATFGGQITFSPKVENIPGFASLSGNEFAEKLVEQVLLQGAEVDSCEVTELRDGKTKTVVTDGGTYEGKAVILATGARHRLLGLPHEEELIGNGISFCAVCDGAFFKDKKVAVIGGGNSALQEALLLADLAAKVTVVQNLDFLTGEQKLREALSEKANVEVILGTVVDSYIGENELTGIRIRREADGTVTELPLDGVFLAVGLVPQNEAFADVISLDGRGYADAGEDCRTGTDGIFVAGDCRTKRIRQVTTAAADGAIAALAACDYVDSLGK